MECFSGSATLLSLGEIVAAGGERPEPSNVGSFMNVQRSGASDKILDARRLQAVRRSQLIDTAPEAAFDELTRTASILLQTPLAFATVVDETQSFWKSSHGLAVDAPNRNSVEESFCKYVVRTERELIVEDASLDERTRENPSVASMGVRAWLGFPLRGPDDQILGSFCVVDTTPRTWSERDVIVMRTLAAAASKEIAVREAFRGEREARTHAESIVRDLQLTLLPPVMACLPGLEVAARFRSAGNGIELVGDFYDMMPLEDGSCGLVLGDVVGKGMQAAKLATLARYTVGALAHYSASPSEILTRLNAVLLRQNPFPDKFLTAVFASFSLCEHGCEGKLSRAGHPPPIMRRANGETTYVDPPGFIVGSFEDFAAPEMAFEMRPGDMLVFYTDGVDEARRGAGAPIFGSDALHDLIAACDPSLGCESLALQIETAVIQHSGDRASDDVAVVVVGLGAEGRVLAAFRLETLPIGNGHVIGVAKRAQIR